MAERDLVFFSYRHDEQGTLWLGRVLDFLKPFRLGPALTVWSDLDIRTGELWNTRIQGAIDRCSVGVLLVNHQFFGSDYICQHELPRLLHDAQAGLLRLVPVLIGPCPELLLQQHGLGAFQFTHPLHKPLRATTGVRREQALSQVAVKIYEAFGGAGAVSPVVVQQPLTAAAEVPVVATTASPQPGALLDVPPMDMRHFVARPEDLATLRTRLLQGNAHALGLTATAAGVGLHGMGGMGKSVLAQALCHDEQVRRAFPDGIAWIALGQQPDILREQNRLLRVLAPEVAPAERTDAAQRALQDALQDKRVLLVVDDLWDARHFSAFDVLGARGRLLLTTRDAGVLAQAGAQPHELQRLPGAAARALLANWSGQDVTALAPDADAVVEETGGLPLALALAGAQAADGVAWAALARELRAGRLRFLDHPYGSVYAALGRSVEHLPTPDRNRYLELAVFPEDVAVPAATVARLWAMAGLTPAEAERLLARLARCALLSLQGDGADQRMGLHDLQHDFVRARCDDLGALHRRLLDAHRQAWGLPAGAEGWAQMPKEEPYLWHRLAAHLVAAGRQEELDTALLDLSFLKARLDSVTTVEPPRADVAALVADCALASVGAAARLVGRTLLRSGHVLAEHADQIGLQLFGRLGRADEPLLHALAQQGLLETAAQAWVPTLPALQSPGAQLEVLGHQAVSGALMLPDGRRVLSWASDGTLRLWNLEQPGSYQIFTGHEDGVRGALILFDGRSALSWAADRTLRLWDLQQPGAHQTFTGHENLVNGALLLPDRRRSLSWANDGTLRLWDLGQPDTHQTLTGHEDWVYGALLLEGLRALSWSHDGTLRRWDLTQPGKHLTLAGHEGAVIGALLRDGRRALSWGSDCTLRMWNLDQPDTHRIFTGHEDSVIGALLLPDGRRALTWARDRTLRLWDLEQPSTHQTYTGHEGSIIGALLLPDGRRVLSWAVDGTLRLWDMEQPGTHQTFSGHKNSVRSALLLPDSRRVLSWADDSTPRLWDLEQPGTLQTLVGHEGWVSGALLLQEGRRALSWSEDSTVRLWDLEQPGTHQSFTGHEDSVNGALLSFDGRRVLSWSQDSTLRLWDLEQPGEHQTCTGHEDSVQGALLLSDGRRALSWSHDHTMRLWNLGQPGRFHTFTGHEDSVNGALILPDGRRTLSWSQDSTLRIWDLEQPGTHQTLAGHKGWVNGALLLPDGRRALSWAYDHTVRLWDLEQPGAHQTFIGHEGWVNGALLLPDGRRALSWGDSTLRLWNIEQPGTHQTLAGHEGWINGAVLLPDGRRALSWGDGTLRIWDLEQPGKHQKLIGHGGGVRGALLLPSARHVLSWSADGTLRLWDLQHLGTPMLLTGHGGRVDGALLLPGGSRALSWAADRTLRLWDLPTGAELSCYRSDATPTAVTMNTAGTLAFVGDALGFVQILRIKPPAL